MTGLSLKPGSIQQILTGKKTWELRIKPTEIRGRIALIKGGAKSICGTAKLTDCIGPLTLELMNDNADKHQIPLESLGRLLYRRTYALVLADVQAFAQPIPVNVRGGAWVKLTPENVPDRFGELQGVEIPAEKPKVEVTVYTPVIEAAEAKVPV